MSEHEQEPKKEKKRRSIFIRMLPKVRLRSEGMRVDDEAKNLWRRMHDTRHHCPRDGTPMHLDDVYPTGDDGEIIDGSEPYRTLVCPECRFTIPVAQMIEEARMEIEPLQKAERHFFLFGAAIAVGFGAISILNGNIWTLIGGLCFALTLMLRALLFRYRRWQALEMRMFEERAPIRDWLRAEFQNYDK